jgi:glutathione synthase/RimK-type ligase-like ATP-grasp enzyme
MLKKQLKNDARFRGKKILILDGNARQSAIILKELSYLGCDIYTLNFSRLDVGFTSKYSKTKYLCKKCQFDDYEYEKKIKELIYSIKFDIVIPLLERSTNILVNNYADFIAKTTLGMPNISSYSKAYNKQITFEICKMIDVSHPRTLLQNEEIDFFVKDVKFPLALKPNNGIGSIGFKKVLDENQLKTLIDLGLVKRNEYVIQEFVTNSKYQHNTYIYIDRFSNVKTALVAKLSRTYPVDAGTPGFFEIVDRPDIIQVAIKLLKKMNWTGYASVCFIESEDDHDFKVMEINGRISASIKICHMSDVSIAQQILEDAFNYDVRLNNTNGKVGYYLRHTHADIMWFLKSKDRFKSKPSFCPSVCSF